MKDNTNKYLLIGAGLVVTTIALLYFKSKKTTPINNGGANTDVVTTPKDSNIHPRTPIYVAPTTPAYISPSSGGRGGDYVSGGSRGSTVLPYPIDVVPINTAYVPSRTPIYVAPTNPAYVSPNSGGGRGTVTIGRRDNRS